LIGLVSVLAFFAATEIPQPKRRSVTISMTPGQPMAIQNDRYRHPCMLWVLDGDALWKS